MPITLETLQAKVSTQVLNKTNAKLVKDYDAFMDVRRLSEARRKNNLKAMTYYGAWLAKHFPNLTFAKVNNREKHILPFLNQYRKTSKDDPEEIWVTTWNDYRGRLIHFYRWLHNIKIPSRSYDKHPIEDWETPEFVQIKKQKTKRKSTYAANETWQRDEVLAIIPYEQEIRNKAIITALWDMDGRNHELTRIKIKHVRFQETYAEGEIPFQTKTGGGPILLRLSFPYLLEFMNKHPLRNDPEAPLFCNLKGGKMLGDELDPDYLWRILDNLKKRIKTLVQQGKLQGKEREKLQQLLNVKAWNPYCFRTSAIRHDCTYLTHYALTQKVRWSPNSRQPARYMAQILSDDVKDQILKHDGIITEKVGPQPIRNVCPKCQKVNPHENLRCSKCSYPLSQQALDEIKAEEEKRVLELQEQLKRQQEESNKKFTYIISLIQKNPRLARIKPEELEKLEPRPAKVHEDNLSQ